ncbi:MAG: hypothetical protein KGZ85_15685 [Ignavibacterium sp.]|nr:hypothetical protein [Ignavibacterium sp.]
MKTYKLKNTDLMLNGKLISEGSEVTLSEKDSEDLSAYLIPIDSEQKTDTKSQPENSTKKRSK